MLPYFHVYKQLANIIIPISQLIPKMSFNKWSVIVLIGVALSVSAAEDVNRDTEVSAEARRAKILTERFAEYMKSSATSNEKKVTPLLSCKHSSKE